MTDAVGRLPGNTRAGTTASAVPSARTSSAVLPNASARVWAKELARGSSWMSVLCDAVVARSGGGGEQAGEEHLVPARARSAAGVPQRVRRVRDGDEVGRAEPGPLVDQLVE